ncbi:hypothetical protein K501DRAFT_269537 [Backusella circina FSU 941]|nr:hypothetical protein K501DRAFT_269537 [Backusella circina FSU 941]
MKTGFIALPLFVLSFISTTLQQDIDCNTKNKLTYDTVVDYATTLQKKIDEASKNGIPAVYFEPGLFSIDPKTHILLKKGVSLIGAKDKPTVITVNSRTESGTIQVTSDNAGWSIQGIVFENVNILTENQQQNEDDLAILNNVFLNGSSITSKNGHQLYIDGNVFLRSESDIQSKSNAASTSILFDTQENSVISNNLFGMDLRQMDSLLSFAPIQLQHSLKNIKFIHNCLKQRIGENEQGYLSSAIQLYNTQDITIKLNMMNATAISGKDQISQDQHYAIKLLGGNQTLVLQNFISGWQLQKNGSGIEITSAVDFLFISNYLANTALQLFISKTSVEYLQLCDIVIYHNFFFKNSINKNDASNDNEWLHHGISFYDFYTARLNNTIETPIYNKIVPISPNGWGLAISENKFSSSLENLDPDIISLGNIHTDEASLDKKNCYVTTPLIPGSEHEELVQVLWRQQFEESVYTRNGGRVPLRNDLFNDENLIYRVPAQFRDLYIPDYWKAFRLDNNSMIDPNTPCYSPRYV